MRTIRCVEPALAVGNLQYVVQVDATDELLFPHVDSCLAIAFLLADGRLIGGHVGMQLPNSPNLDPHGNAMAVANQMLALSAGAGVTRVVLVGDANWEQDFIQQLDVVQDVINLSGSANSLFLDTGAFGGGVDFSFNPRRQMVFMQRCVGNHALVFQLPYADIVGHVRKRLA
jgi:hypothetical protein